MLPGVSRYALATRNVATAAGEAALAAQPADYALTWEQRFEAASGGEDAAAEVADEGGEAAAVEGGGASASSEEDGPRGEL